MIDSAEIMQIYNKKIITIPRIEWALEKYRKRRIAKYCLGGGKENDKTKDIVYMSPVGGNMTLLNHFIAIDHRRSGAIVLAIRGTYSVSGLFIDASGYTQSFCDGVAHKGTVLILFTFWFWLVNWLIVLHRNWTSFKLYFLPYFKGVAERAVAIWENTKTKEKLLKALQDYPSYDLIICGHSLGAGAACLLTIKLYHDQVVKDRKVRCFAFAPPPVYKAQKSNENVALAIANTTAFVHENDCVPFLSANSVRRLAALFHEMDNLTRGNPVQRKLYATGFSKPTSNMIETVGKYCRPLPPVAGADLLSIPAPFVIWMRPRTADSKGRPVYNSMLCRSDTDSDFVNIGLDSLSIYMNLNMIADHMMPNYELGINSILAQMLRNEQGYVAELWQPIPSWRDNL